jgi:hypothetical protein
VNTKDFLRLGVPLGAATRRATDFFQIRHCAAAMIRGRRWSWKIIIAANSSDGIDLALQLFDLLLDGNGISGSRKFNPFQPEEALTARHLLIS